MSASAKNAPDIAGGMANRIVIGVINYSYNEDNTIYMKIKAIPNASLMFWMSSLKSSDCPTKAKLIPGGGGNLSFKIFAAASEADAIADIPEKEIHYEHSKHNP